MKKITFLITSVLIALVFLISCSDNRSNNAEQYKRFVEKNGKIKVMSTTSMIDELVKGIAGDHVDRLTLIRGELDPHSYQLVKGDDDMLSYSDIIFYNGLELEHGPSLHTYLLKNKKAVSLGDRIEQIDPTLVVFVNGQKDPHIWMDISLWAKAIPIIVEELSLKDPQHADEYRVNGDKLVNELLQAHTEATKIMHEAPENRRYLVTSHDAFNYFSRAYLSEDNEIKSGEWKKRFAAPEGLAPESQLSTTDIKEIIEHMRRYHIELLFPETNVSRDSIKKILQAGREQGLNLKIACCPLYGDAMGPPGSDGDTYIKMILYDAKTIVSYMKD